MRLFFFVSGSTSVYLSLSLTCQQDILLSVSIYASFTKVKVTLLFFFLFFLRISTMNFDCDVDLREECKCYVTALRTYCDVSNSLFL